MPQYASKRLKATEEKLLDALSGESTSDHVFVISETLDHIEDPKKRIAVFPSSCRAGSNRTRGIPQALRTIPGIDQMGAGMLVEIGDASEQSSRWPTKC